MNDSRTLLSGLLCAIFFLLAPGLSGQVDAKVNVGSALFGGVGVAADIGLSENSSLSAGLGYASTKFGSEDYRYANFRIIPEYRYYFSPRAGADRFFVGGYGKLAFVTAENEDDDTTVDATRGALGILFGNKWVTDGGFVFELNAGLGRATVFGLGDADGEMDTAFEAAYGALTSVDFRLGIIAGYRF